MVASATSNEFIHVACCIRPNMSHKPDFFEPSAVLQQLRAWSVCQAVHFRQIFSESVIAKSTSSGRTWTSLLTATNQQIVVAAKIQLTVRPRMISQTTRTRSRYTALDKHTLVLGLVLGLVIQPKLSQQIQKLCSLIELFVPFLFKKIKHF